MNFFKLFVIIGGLILAFLFVDSPVLAASGSKAGDRKPPEYIAISYSKKTGAYGYATNKKSKLSAKRRASQECRKHARDCKPAVWTKLACASVATSGGGWGGHYGSSRKVAIRNALKKCSSYKNNKKCSTLVTICQ